MRNRLDSIVEPFSQGTFAKCHLNVESVEIVALKIKEKISIKSD